MPFSELEIRQVAWQTEVGQYANTHGLSKKQPNGARRGVVIPFMCDMHVINTEQSFPHFTMVFACADLLLAISYRGSLV